MVEVRLETEPVPKGRPRFTKSGHTYTPKATREFEAAVRFAFMSSTCEKLPVYAKDVPIIVEALFGKSVPKGLSKKKTAMYLSGQVSPVRRPDLDNYLKAVLDGLNGCAFEDDSQIIRTIAEKLYTDSPFVHVRIWAAEEYYKER